MEILILNISPSFSSSASFACPLQQSDVSSLLGAKGIITGNSNLTSSNRGNRRRDNVLDDRAEHEALARVSRSLTDAMLAAPPYR